EASGAAGGGADTRADTAAPTSSSTGRVHGLYSLLSRWCCGTGGVGADVGGHVAGSLGYVQWSMRHSHTSASKHQLVEKERRDQSKTPSYRWCNAGMLPGLPTLGMSRRLEVHDLVIRYVLLATEARYVTRGADFSS